jgi:DNA repair protein RadA/Sms
MARFSTGIGELDRVLGGGLVPGSLVLLGGSPGIGKSTLTASALGNLASERKVLYVTGEESPAQVKLRAERLGPAALEVPIVAETDLEAVIATIEAEHPDVCVIDSVQTLYTPDMTGAPGSVGQVREVRSPAHASSSTSSTVSSSSRASASARTAPSVRSRTDSAPRTRSASSRCATTGSPR